MPLVADMHHRIRSSGASGTDGAADFDAGFETWTVAYATPTGLGRCRLFARFPFRFPPPPPPRGPLARLLPRLPNLPALVFRREAGRIGTHAQRVASIVEHHDTT